MVAERDSSDGNHDSASFAQRIESGLSHSHTSEVSSVGDNGRSGGELEANMRGHRTEVGLDKVSGSRSGW